MTEKTRLRWRKLKKDHKFSPETHELHRGTKILARIQASGRHWFSYGLSLDTSRTPFLTLEEAKADAIARVRIAEKTHVQEQD